MEKSDKIYVAGHNGLLGSAIIRLLKEKGYTNLITKSSKELDLCNQKETFDDIFYAGVFCDDEVYVESKYCPEEFNYKNDKSGEKFNEFSNGNYR